MRPSSAGSSIWRAAPDASIIIVPTAGDADEYDEHWTGLRQFREQGARNLTVLHTRDRKVADTEAFAKPIASAGGVFFAGGRQWRIMDSYLNTRVQQRTAEAPRPRRRDRRHVGRRHGASARSSCAATPKATS